MISDEFIEKWSFCEKGASKEELREKRFIGFWKTIATFCKVKLKKTEAELENTIKEFTTAKRTEQRTAAEKLTDKRRSGEKAYRFECRYAGADKEHRTPEKSNVS